MFDFEVVERICILSDNGKGTTLELNRVSFDHKPPKLDIRKWYNGKPEKGITLTEEQANTLYSALKGILSGFSLPMDKGAYNIAKKAQKGKKRAEKGSLRFFLAIFHPAKYNSLTG